jgi:hypothetical protein
MGLPDPSLAVQADGVRHPSTEQVRDLVEVVHGQLDHFRVPRDRDGRELTLLGRMATFLDACGAPTPTPAEKPDETLPVIGQLWGRGPRPSCGSTEQVCAWLRSVPGSPQHGVIIKGPQDPPEGIVWVQHVGKHGEARPGYPAVRPWTLRDFMVEWWRP